MDFKLGSEVIGRASPPEAPLSVGRVVDEPLAFSWPVFLPLRLVHQDCSWLEYLREV
jgi:hypothetical protein